MSSAVDNVPEDRRGDFRKAQRLAWLTIAYLASAILLMALVLGSSQALKTAWYDDILSLFPPILFLVGGKIAGKKPSVRYPFGYGRAVSAAYLGAAVAHFGVGAWLILASVQKLIEREHPSIGGAQVFGHVVWQGWLAIPVLLWSGMPAILLGWMKRPFAERLHDKVLLADANMNTADWQTASAALLGVIGVGFGLWWADAVAALVIAFDIARDGLKNIGSALADLMDRRPQKLLEMEDDPLPAEVTDYLRSLDWVEDAIVRVREQGRQFLGEALVVPRSDDRLVERIEEAAKGACTLDWRLIQLLITPVREIPAEVKERDPSREAPA